MVVSTSASSIIDGWRRREISFISGKAKLVGEICAHDDAALYDSTLPTLIFVHGMASSMAGWDMVWPHLAETNARLVRLDLRGFGRSSSGEENFSFCEDLRALLDHLQLQSAVFVGLSMGGAIALGMAVDYPERVSALALISPALRGWEWSADWKALYKPIVKAARGGDMNEARRLWLAHPMFTNINRNPELASVFKQSVLAYHGDQWRSNYETPVLPDLDQLHSLKCPTLLLEGSEDMPDFQLIACLLEASIPHIQRIDLAEAGHMLTLERPAEIAREIALFAQAASL